MGGKEDPEPPSWAKTMIRGNQKILKELTTMNTKVNEAINISREAKSAVVTLQADMKNLRDEHNTFKDQVEVKVAETVQKEAGKAMKDNFKMGINKGDSDDDDHPERLIVVRGWPKNF